jgi:hypothetical protein
MCIPLKSFVDEPQACWWDKIRGTILVGGGVETDARMVVQNIFCLHLFGLG